MPNKGDEFIFPVTDGTVKSLGGDQALKSSTLVRNQPIRGESHSDLLGESEGSAPAQHFQDSYLDAGEAISGDLSAVITLNQESNFRRREKNHVLFH